MILIRNTIIRLLYKGILKHIFFQADPEKIHDSMIWFGKVLGSNPITRLLTSIAFYYSNKKLNQNILGINFPNPVGLAAGFDKDAQIINIMKPVSFGYTEVGSITADPCEGNKGKRLWRFPKSKSLLVYYGLKNKGAKVLSNKLRNLKFKIPVGTSIAKTNSKKTIKSSAGIKDYVGGFKAFTNIGDYYTVNISCPNTFGGEPFHNPKKLSKLLKELDKIKTKKPIFLKISPDLNKKSLDSLISIAKKHRVHGFICSNLTKVRDNHKLVETDIPDKGGFGGKVTEHLANEHISYIYKKTKGKFVIIGCGGISSAEDAYKKIKAGASLVQLITGMIYEGPQLISEINHGLVKLLKKDGYGNISEAVGKNLQ